jgi:hypothetical protein
MASGDGNFFKREDRMALALHGTIRTPKIIYHLLLLLKRNSYLFYA